MQTKVYEFIAKTAKEDVVIRGTRQEIYKMLDSSVNNITKLENGMAIFFEGASLELAMFIQQYYKENELNTVIIPFDNGYAFKASGGWVK